MKRLLTVLISFSILVTLFCLKTFAEEEDKYYNIFMQEDVYVLTVCENGTEYELHQGSLNEVITLIDGGCERSKIVFDDVKTDQAITFPYGKYIISGEITIEQGGCIVISRKTEVIFENAELIFLNGPSDGIVIDGGSSIVRNSTVINRTGPAVALSDNVANSFVVESGELISAGSEALLIKNGYVEIVDGKIRSLFKEAIINKGELRLSGNSKINGVGNDIYTHKAIYLSGKSGIYSSGDCLKLKYYDNFKNGYLNYVFYEAKEENIKNIDLYSENDEKYDITYFYEYPGVLEKNFAGVYLPFNVSVFDGEKIVYEEKRLYGEYYSNSFNTEKDGFSFRGIFKDTLFSEAVENNYKITDDTLFYLKYQLLKPSVEILPFEFTYDGNEKNVAFERIYHSLENEGGGYTYEWYRDGILVSKDSFIKVKNTHDSGKYSCKIIFSYLNEKSELVVDNINVTVNKAIVDIPHVEPAMYNGTIIKPEYVPSSLYVCNSEGFANAGKYKIKFSLVDAANYRWRDTAEETIETDFEILPSKIHLELKDYYLYLLSEIEDIEYSIKDGFIALGDELNIEQVVEDGKIILKTNNPNYILEGNVAKVIKVQRLSPESSKKIFFIILFLLFLIFLILIFIKKITKLKKRFSKRRNTPEKLKPNNNLISSKKTQLLTAPKEDSEFEQKNEETKELQITETESEEERDPLDFGGIDAEHADELITDSLAKDLLKRSKEIIYTEGKGKEIINVDTLDKNFRSGERVDVNILKKKKLIREDTAYIKVLARGEISKSLNVYATDFSLSAIKMIVLTGGEAVKVVSCRKKQK